MKPFVVFIAFFSITASAQTQINKCVDASGKTVYSQGPCPKGAKASSVATAPPVSLPATKAGNSGKAADAAKSSGPKTTAELEQEYRKRQKEQAEALKEEDQKLAAAKSELENCVAARQQVASFEQGGRQSRIDEKGERVFLDDAQIEAEKQRARQAVQSSCK